MSNTNYSQLLYKHVYGGRFTVFRSQLFAKFKEVSDANHHFHELNHPKNWIVWTDLGMDACKNFVTIFLNFTGWGVLSHFVTLKFRPVAFIRLFYLRYMPRDALVMNSYFGHGVTLCLSLKIGWNKDLAIFAQKPNHILKFQRQPLKPARNSNSHSIIQLGLKEFYIYSFRKILQFFSRTAVLSYLRSFLSLFYLHLPCIIENYAEDGRTGEVWLSCRFYHDALRS